MKEVIIEIIWGPYKYQIKYCPYFIVDQMNSNILIITFHLMASSGALMRMRSYWMEI